MLDKIGVSDETVRPACSNRSLPGWKLFSTTMPTPTVVACAFSTISFKPSDASPFAKKSSIINILSSLFMSIVVYLISILNLAIFYNII